MKIFSITILQNQVDIIKELIEHHREVFDDLYFWDIGSTDGTTEILISLSKEYKNVHLKNEQTSFANDLRGVFYHEIKNKYSEKDWYYQLDADEFLHSDIRKYIKRANFWGANYIRSYHFNFKFTEIEYQNRAQNINDLNHFIVDYSEIRAFRNLSIIEWSIGNRSILPLGLIAPINLKKPHFQFIKIFHYQQRSIQQIEKRIDEKLELLKSDNYKEVKGISYKKYMHTKVEDYLADSNNCRKLNNNTPRVLINERVKIIYTFFIKPYTDAISRKIKLQ